MSEPTSSAPDGDRRLPPLPAEMINDVVELMRGQFPHEPKYSHRYIKWRYVDHPLSGPAFASRRDEGGALLMFGATTVAEWAKGAGPTTRVGVVGDAAAVPSARKGSWMVNAIAEGFPDGLATGITWGFGIPNDNSLAPLGSMFGASDQGTLPVTAMVPGAPRRGGQTVRAADLSEGQIESWLAQVNQTAGAGWRSVWSPRTLAWRLSHPHREFLLHMDEQMAAITTTLHTRRGRIAVVVKSWPRPGATRPSLARLAGPIAMAHRTPGVIHVGFNENVRVSGKAVPTRVLPAPLHILTLDLGGLGGDTDPFRPGTIELLDFDAV